MNVDLSTCLWLLLPALAAIGCREELPELSAGSLEVGRRGESVSLEARASQEGFARSITFTPAETPSAKPRFLEWDSEIKEIYAQPGIQIVECSYEVSNNTGEEASITLINPSCGCSVVKSPPLPWTLAPGDRGTIGLEIDLKGKHGILTKAVLIESTFGRQNLVFKVHIPEFSKEARSTRTMRERLENMKLAAADRQAVFKGDCRKCHFDTAVGKTGETLFQAACGICHDTPHRATMVPDLAAVGVSRDAAYWRYWITAGKPDSLMPAFAEKNGGPLTGEQIDHLVDYLTGRFEADIAERTNAIASD